MNQKFDELMYRSGLTAQGCWDSMDDYDQEAIMKFAELIVRECAQVCINEGKTYAVESAGQYQSNLYATAIKAHFGVEE